MSTIDSALPLKSMSRPKLTIKQKESMLTKILSDANYDSTGQLPLVLDTSKFHQLFSEYIEESGDEKVYQTIQEIRELFSKIVNEANEAGLQYKLDLPQERGEFDYIHQTRFGFSLYIGVGPDYLITPLGRIKLQSKPWFSDLSGLSVAEALIHRLKANFEKIQDPGSGPFYEGDLLRKVDKIRKIHPENFTKIDIKQVIKKRGVRCLVVPAQSCNHGIYKITQVGNRALPIDRDSSDTNRPKKSPRSSLLVRYIWDVLEKQSRKVPTV